MIAIYVRPRSIRHGGCRSTEPSQADLTTSAPIFVAGYVARPVSLPPSEHAFNSVLFLAAGALAVLLPYEPRGKASL